LSSVVDANVTTTKPGEKLDGFVREAEAQEQLLGGRCDARARKDARDDSSAKNIVQMKSVPLSAFEM
jgi:hypothetical protein